MGMESDRLDKHRQAAAASVAFLIFAVRPGSASVPANRGFTAILDDVERLSPFRKTGRLLIASDEIGEGMFVAAVAVRDTRPGRYALRASKSPWPKHPDGTWENYRPLI